jgi:hypothetical protein
MDWADDQRRLKQQAQQTDFVEIVRKTSNGYDPRDQVTFYKTERLGVYSSRSAALEAILKMHPELTIQPLKVDG